MQWKTFALVILCLLPSVAIAALLSAKLTLLWFLLTTIVMAIYAVMAFARQTGQVENYDQVVELTEQLLDNRFSQSQSQIHWHVIDEVEETNDAFLIRRLERYSLIPKRIVGDQIQACRDLFARVTTRPPEQTESLPLYRELFSPEGPFPIKRFFYEQDDLKNALQTTFRLSGGTRADCQTPEKTGLGWRAVRVCRDGCDAGVPASVASRRSRR